MITEIKFDLYKSMHDSIQHTGAKNTLSEMFKELAAAIETYNGELKSDLSEKTKSENFDIVLKVINESKNKIRGADSISKRRSDAIIEDIQKKLLEYKKHNINYPLEIAKKVVPTEQEEAIFLQQRILEDTDVKGAFQNALEKIKKVHRENYRTPLLAIVCAEPSKNNPTYLNWMDTFVKSFHKNLEYIWARTYLLRSDCSPPGVSSNNYHQDGIKSSDSMLLIGSENLVTQYEDNIDVIEKLVIARRQKADHKLNVFPLLISGDCKTSFPPEYKDTPFVNFKELGYLNSLIEIISYFSKGNKFESIWTEFLNSIPPLKQKLLISNISEVNTNSDLIRAEIKKMKNEIENQKIRDEEARNRAARALLGLVTVSESSRSATQRQEYKVEFKPVVSESGKSQILAQVPGGPSFFVEKRGDSVGASSGSRSMDLTADAEDKDLALALSLSLRGGPLG